MLNIGGEGDGALDRPSTSALGPALMAKFSAIPQSAMSVVVKCRLGKFVLK